ncbi:hypothetical protein [Thioclava sp.]|uniref:hypothetical protein n=1 Tax=Thioclava sp. TaxID=1933450 RepID=UPI003242D16E
MTDNVTALFGGPTSVPKPDENCIEVLENLLEKARGGEVIAVAIAAKHYDGLATANHGGNIAGYAIIGALEAIKACLTTLNREE